jgi:hypothetical protein
LRARKSTLWVLDDEKMGQTHRQTGRKKTECVWKNGNFAAVAGFPTSFLRFPLFGRDLNNTLQCELQYIQFIKTIHYSVNYNTYNTLNLATHIFT